MLTLAATIGTEIDDRELLDFPLATMDVVLTNKDLADHTIAEVAAMHGRGVVMSKLVRGGEEIPFEADTELNRGDLLRLSGAKTDVERAGAALGTSSGRRAKPTWCLSGSVFFSAASSDC